MATEIKNSGFGTLTLPVPLKGTLAAGQGVVSTLSPAQIREIFGGRIPKHIRVTARPDAVAPDPPDLEGDLDLLGIGGITGSSTPASNTDLATKQYVDDQDVASGPLASGDYTPTLTAVANVSASSVVACRFLRIATVVKVTFSIDITATTGAGTSTTLGISLPVSSSFGGASDCQGFARNRTDLEFGDVVGDSANDRAQLEFDAGATASRTWRGLFSYRVA